MRLEISRRNLILGGGALALTGFVAACSDGDGTGSAAGKPTGASGGTSSVPTTTRGTPGNGGGTVTVRDVRIFDGERVVDADTVIIEGGLITAIGLALTPPDGSEVYEGGGGFVLPGLIDAHGHTNLLDQLGDSLRFGVSTVLDMFSLVALGEQGKELRAKRESLAATDRADFWSAGYLTTATGGHGANFGIEIPVLAPGDDVEAFVAARVDDGADYLKIVIDDGSVSGQDLPTLTADQVNALVASAHQRDLLAVVHCNTWAAAEIALEAGADVLAHMPGGEPPGPELIARIVDAGLAVVATFAVQAFYSCTDDAVEFRDDPRISEFLSDGQRERLSVEIPGCPFAQLDKVLASAAALHEAGAQILTGTDFSNPGCAPGATMLLETELLVRSGLDPVDALRAATSLPAATFGLDDRGLLEVGRRGDLLVVAADPLDDITSLRDISAIWKNGYAVDRSV